VEVYSLTIFFSLKEILSGTFTCTCFCGGTSSYIDDCICESFFDIFVGVVKKTGEGFCTTISTGLGNH